MVSRIIQVVAFLLLCHCKHAFALCSTDFSGEEDYPYKYFQTKTLYDTARGNISSADRPAGCTPKAIVMFLRHGSRHPGADEVDKYQELEELRKRINVTGTAELCSNDLEKILNWENWHQPELDSDLAVTGYAEMKGISERYSFVFPEIFSSNTSYRFISSTKSRTQQSAEAFKDGLFGTVSDRPSTEISNPLTRFYDYCERWLTEVDDNDTLVEDVDAFMEGPVITAIADEFSRRLGIPRDEVSNYLVNRARKEGCAEEEWATGNSSAWCLAFIKQEFQAFEYGDDMEDYLLKSFSNEINYKQSCGTKKFLLSALQNASTSDIPSGHFLFSHSMGVMSLLTEMKVIEDDGPFLSTDYPAKVNRTFRASLYTPGSGNLAIILYDCEGQMKIQIYVNEKLVPMPLDAPNTNGLWNLDSALQYFGFDDPADCQFEQMCSLQYPVTGKPITTTSSASRTLVSTLCVVVVAVGSSIFSHV